MNNIEDLHLRKGRYAMDAKYQMAGHSMLSRTGSDTYEVTVFNERLIASLRQQAMREAFGFYRGFFGTEKPCGGPDELVAEYAEDLRDARAIGLFAPGGIREKDHLNFWCLGRVFDPQCYIESGVYIGSSLHAFLRCPSLSRVIAIDPNLGQLKVPASRIPGAELVEDRDFSGLQAAGLPERTLVYFDDHINTAERIMQAHRLGVRYLLFDDSTGFEGMVQRLYPAVPTIPMILHYDLLTSGDELSWSFQAPGAKPQRSNWFSRARARPAARFTRLTFRITDALLEDCRRARQLIRRCQKLPDLGQYIPQTLPEKMVDTTKYLIELTGGSSSRGGLSQPQKMPPA